MADVEMKAAEPKLEGEEKKEEKEGKQKEEDSKPVPPSPVSEIKSNVALIERAVSSLEPRFTHRLFRTLAALRKKINDGVLRDAIEEVYPKGTYCC
jgi:26S proteasome regulatory subunit N3